MIPGTHNRNEKQRSTLLIVPAIYYLLKCIKYLYYIHYNVYTIYILIKHMRILN